MLFAVLILAVASFFHGARIQEDGAAGESSGAVTSALGDKLILPAIAGAVRVKRHSDGISEPLPGETVVDMARRRYQRGSLKAVEGKWRFMWREDVVQADGSLRRVLRKTWLGDAGELSMREARRLADRIVAPMNDRWYRPGMVITFGEFADQWEDAVLPMRKPSTQSKARQHLAAYLRPAFGDVQIADIHQGRVQVFVAPLALRMRRHSVENILGTLSAILKTAKKWGYAVGPFHREDVELPMVQAPVKRRHFQPATVKAILERATGQWRVLFATAALTGIRPGEVLGLARGDLDMARKVITIQRANDRGRLITLKSRRSYREVPMPEPLRAILQQFLMREWKANGDDLLFVSEAGTPLRLSKVVDKRLHPILKAIGHPMTGLHAFRHTTASVLLSMGVNPKVVQAQLGHEDAETTVNIYGHLIGDEHRVAVEKMALQLLPDVAGDEALALRIQ